MFIVFEGLDGSGSSTQAALLAENLEKLNKKVVQTKEPTTGTIGRLVREYLQHKHSTSPKALQLLFASDREDHLHTLVRPNLAEGKIVISDRYLHSSIAFGARSDEEFNWLNDLYEDFQKPDLVFLLKVLPEECMKRIKGRGSEIELFEKEEVLRRVWENYAQLAQENDNIVLIDGMQSIEEIEQQILNIVQSKLG